MQSVKDLQSERYNVFKKGWTCVHQNHFCLNNSYNRILLKITNLFLLWVMWKTWIFRKRVTDLWTIARASLKRAVKTSPVKNSAKRPTACSRELRSLSAQCSLLQSASAVMFNLRSTHRHGKVIREVTDIHSMKENKHKQRDQIALAHTEADFICNSR